MKRNAKVNVIKVVIPIMLGISLVGCHHNPLLQAETINKIKQNFIDERFMVSDAGICAIFLAKPKTNDSLKTKCDAWVSRYFQSLEIDGVIPANATLEDFKDPAIWQKMMAKQI